jgi:hypothetical protein
MARSKVYARLAGLFAIALCAAHLTACGSGKGNGWLSMLGGELRSGSAYTKVLPAPPGQGLKRPVKYTYDYSSLPAVDGFTVAPMAAETQPDPAPGLSSASAA